MKVIGPNSVAAGLKTLFDVLFYLVLLSSLLTALVAPFDSGPIQFAWEPVAKFELQTPIRAVAVEAETESAMITTASGTLHVTPQDQRLRWMGLLFCLTILGAAAFVLHQLREIFATLRERNPFARSNARRVRLIGSAVIASEIVGAAFRYLESTEMARRWISPDVTFHGGFSLGIGTILSGVMLLVIAEVFRLGARMKEEQDLTV